MTLDEGIGRYWTEHAIHLPAADNAWYCAENWKRIGAGRCDERGRSTPLLGKYFDEVTDDDIAWFISHRRGERVRSNCATVIREDGTVEEPPFVSNRTVNIDIEFLRAVFNRARKNWSVWIGDKPPGWGDHLLSVPEERIRSATDDEFWAIHDAIVKLRPDFLDVMLFLGRSGRREGEVFRLEKRYVDRRNMRYAVWEKGVSGTQGKRLRWYPMTADQLEIIDRNWMNHPVYVFTYVAKASVRNRKRGIEIVKGQRYPFTKDGWRKQWAEILEEAKVVDFRVHDWRHDFGTRVLDQTGNLKLAKELLGHSDIKTTAKYAHVGDKTTRDALAQIPRVPKKSRGDGTPDASSG